MSQAGSIRKRGQTWTAYYFTTARGGEETTIPKGQDGSGGGKRVREAGERIQRSKGGFRTKKEAQKFLNSMVSSIDQGTYRVQKKITLEEFVESEWLPSMASQVRSSTLASYCEALVGRVLPRLGRHQLAAITPKMIGDLRDELLASGKRGPREGTGLAPKTVRNTQVTLRKVLADAVTLGYIASNPAVGVKGPRLVGSEMNAWNAVEARKFLDHVRDDRLRALWALLLTTGLRRGEALGLRWSDIDLDSGTVAIVRTLVAVGYTPERSEPKTRRGRRRVDVDPLAVTELREHRCRQQEEQAAWGEAWTDEGLVFCREDGTELNPQLVSQSFNRLTRDAGVPNIRLHDLRHTMATLALAAGIHVKVVSERLGHANVSITLDIYSHVLEGMQSDAAAKLGQILLGEG